MGEKKYFNELNIVRGIAVLLVTIGHSFPDLQTGMKYPLAFFIRNYIYDFHMAVFFFVSGFLCLQGLKKYTFIDECSKKTLRLLLPYFAYSFVSIVLKLFFNSYANNQFEWSGVWKIFLGDSPNYGLWFLWTLFFIWLVTDLLLRVKMNSVFILALGVILNIFQLYLSGGFLMNFMKFFVFYAAGVVVYQSYDRVGKFLAKSENTALSILGFFIIFVFAIVQTLNIIGEEFYLITGAVGVFQLYKYL